MVVVACSLTPGPDAGTANIGEAVLPMANAALASGQNETARRLYSRLLAVMPDSFDARMGLARVSMADRDPEQAATWYLSAVVHAASADERHAALLAHGRAALAAGQHGEALRSFRTLADRKEGATGALAAWGFNGIGVVRWLEGDPRSAVAAIEQAIVRNPDEPAFESNLNAATKMLGTLDLGPAPEPVPAPAPLPDILVASPTADERDIDADHVADTAPSAAAAAPVPGEPGLCRWWRFTWRCRGAPGEAAAGPAAGPEAVPVGGEEVAAAAPGESGLCRWWLFTWPCEDEPGEAEVESAAGPDDMTEEVIAAGPNRARSAAPAAGDITAESPMRAAAGTSPDAAASDGPAVNWDIVGGDGGTAGPGPGPRVVAREGAPGRDPRQRDGRGGEGETAAGWDYDVVAVRNPAAGAAERGGSARGGSEAFVVVEDGAAYLQVGAYADREAAEAVAGRLRAVTDETVALSTVETGAGAHVRRVRIGPVTRDRAEELRQLVGAAGIRF